MMAQGMRALTGAATTAEAWRRFFTPSDVVGIKVNCGGYPNCISAYEIVAETVRQLMALGVPVSQIYVYERFQNQMDECNYAAAPAAGRADGRRRTREPEHRQQRLRSRDLPRGQSLRRGGHALEHDAAGLEAAHQDHQHPEYEGSRRDRRDGMPEEHRLRQLLQRRAHAPAGQVAHLFGRWHAGVDGAGSIANRAADHGRHPRRLARRPVRADDASTSSIRSRSCSAPIRWRSIGCCSTSSTTSGKHTARSRSGIAIPRSLNIDDGRARDADPNVNIIIREPGHVEYAASLGLGVYDLAKIKVQELTV